MLTLALVCFMAVIFLGSVAVAWNALRGFDLDRREAKAEAVIEPEVAPAPGEARCMLCKGVLRVVPRSSDEVVREIEKRVDDDTAAVEHLLRVPGKDTYRRLYAN